MAGAVRQYGFINAKLRSRLSLLLDEAFFKRLREAPSLAEALQYVKESPYREEAALYETSGDLKTVEAALWRREIALVAELSRYLSGELASFHSALLLRYETDIVRNAVRLWFDAHIKRKSIGGEVGYLYSQPLVHDISLEALVNAEDFPSLIETVKDTPYAGLLKDSEEDLIGRSKLFDFENRLDRFFYQQLLDAVRGLKPSDSKIAEELIQMEIDLRNVDRIARLALFYPPEARHAADIVIPGGGFSGQLLDRALSVKRGEDAAALLLSERYGKNSASSFASHAKLPMLEGMLRQIRREKTLSLLQGYPFTIGVILAYIFLKRKEIGALISILNAHYYGLSPSEMREGL